MIITHWGLLIKKCFDFWKKNNYSNAKNAIKDVEEAIKLSKCDPDSIKALVYGFAYNYTRKAYQEAKLMSQMAKSDAESLTAKSEAQKLDSKAFGYFKEQLRYVSFRKVISSWKYTPCIEDLKIKCWSNIYSLNQTRVKVEICLNNVVFTSQSVQ